MRLRSFPYRISAQSADTQRVIHTVQPATRKHARDIAEVANWAYRGKSADGEDPGAWTTERHLIDGIRTTELDVLDIMRECDRRGPRGEVLLVALGRKKQVLGTIHGKLVETGVAELGLFSVDPDVQSAGIGSRLIETAEKHAYWKMDAKKAIMYVISVREELLSWYYKLGYKATEERVPFPPAEANVGIPRVEGLEFIKLEKQLDWDAGMDV